MKKNDFPTKEMCKVCQCQTWHKILSKSESSKNDEESGIWETTTSYMLQCKGCDNVCLLVEYSCSENYDPETGEIAVDKVIYPSPYKNDRELIKKTYYIPNNVLTIYQETVAAFNERLFILAGIGVRSTIEAIAIDQGISIRGIQTKIQEMVRSNIITSDGAELLELIKDMGNKAVHEIKKHGRDELSLCIDIIEDVIRNLYILPNEAKRARETLS